MEHPYRLFDGVELLLGDPAREQGLGSKRVRFAATHGAKIEMRQAKRSLHQLDFPIVIMKKEHKRGPWITFQMFCLRAPGVQRGSVPLTIQGGDDPLIRGESADFATHRVRQRRERFDPRAVTDDLNTRRWPLAKDTVARDRIKRIGLPGGPMLHLFRTNGDGKGCARVFTL